MALLYVLFLCGLVWFEYHRDRGALKWDFLSVFNVSFALAYLVPAIFLSYDPDRYATFGPQVTSDRTGGWLTFILIVIGYVCVVAGFQSGRRIRQRLRLPEVDPRKRRAFIGGLLVLAAASIYVYSSEHSGLSSAITDAAAIRAGHVQATQLSFFKRFLPTAWLASFWIFSMMLSRNWRWTWATGSGLALALALSVIGFLLTSSRGNIVFFLGTVFLMVASYRRDIGLVRLAAAGVLSVLVLLYGKLLFSSLLGYEGDMSYVWDSFQGKVDERNLDPFVLIVREFQYPFVSLQHTAAVEFSTGLEYRWFLDWIYGFFSLIPEKLIPVSVPDTVAYVNTEGLTGIYDSEIPPGLIALGMYSMGIVGVIATCAVFGALGGAADAILLPRKKQKHYVALMLYSLGGVLWGFRTIQGEPRVFFQANFVFLTVVVYLLFRFSRAATTSSSASESPAARSTSGS